MKTNLLCIILIQGGSIVPLIGAQKNCNRISHLSSLKDFYMHGGRSKKFEGQVSMKVI